MRLRTRLERLERRVQPSRTCLVCGLPPEMKRTTIVLTWGYKGSTKRPPDPEPICPACQLPTGGIFCRWGNAERRGDAAADESDRDDDS